MTTRDAQRHRAAAAGAREVWMALFWGAAAAPAKAGAAGGRGKVGSGSASASAAAD